MNSASERRGPLRAVPGAVALWLLAFCLFAWGLSPVTAAPLDEARALMKEGRNEAAIVLLEGAVKEAEGAERAQLLNALGWLNFMEDRSEAAARLYEAALQEALQAGDRALATRIKNNIGMNHYVEGDLEAAEKVFTDTAAEGSTVAKRYLEDVFRQKKVAKVNDLVRRGVDARMAGKFDDAVEQYSNALRIDPANPRALEFRGYAYLRMGELAKSREDLEKSFEIDPSRLATVVNLLKVSCAEGDRQAFDRFAKQNAEAVAKHAAAITGDPELRRLCGRWTAALPSS